MINTGKHKRWEVDVYRIPFEICLCLLLMFSLAAGMTAFGADTTNRNRSERVEWFRDAGFGLFVTWGFDSQLGSGISHSMVGASTFVKVSALGS